MPIGRNRESLVISIEAPATRFENTAHRADLVIGDWVIAPTVDEEKRLNGQPN